MKKNSNARKILHRIYIAAILLSVFVCLFSVGNSLSVKNLPDSRLYTNQLMDFSDDWYSSDNYEAKSSIPSLSSWKAASGTSVTIFKTLPELTDYDCLFIDVNFMYISVFVDDICIYDYSSDYIGMPSHMTGHFISQIPLDTSMSGKTLSLNIYQPNTLLQLGVNSVIIGSGSAYIADYLYSHTELVVSLLLIVIASFLLLAVYLWQCYKQRGSDYKMFLSLSLFLALSALWIFSDSTLPQLLWENNLGVCVLSFLCFMSLPIPLLSFVSTLCTDNYNSLMAIRILLLSNIAVQGILYCTGTFNFLQMLPATHFFIALCVIVLIVFLLKNYKKNKSPYARPLLLSLILLIMSGVVSLAYFYVSPQTDNSRFFRYGFLMFIGFLVYLCFKVMLTFTHDYAERQILKKLAYTDILTGTENRLAFEDFIDRIRSSAAPSPVTLYMFDLNNLKITNDTYGHKAGDMILKSCADLILDTFKGHGRVFRVGGDEFVSVIQAPFQEPEKMTEKLLEKIRSSNEISKYPFTVSVGYASSSVCGDSIDTLLKKADTYMYKNKEDFKNNRNRHE